MQTKTVNVSLLWLRKEGRAPPGECPLPILAVAPVGSQEVPKAKFKTTRSHPKEMFPFMLL